LKSESLRRKTETSLYLVALACALALPGCRQGDIDGLIMLSLDLLLAFLSLGLLLALIVTVVLRFTHPSEPAVENAAKVESSPKEKKDSFLAAPLVIWLLVIPSVALAQAFAWHSRAVFNDALAYFTVVPVILAALATAASESAGPKLKALAVVVLLVAIGNMGALHYVRVQERVRAGLPPPSGVFHWPSPE
jgi:hypothetical protein